jgi:hypothetical protein
MGLRPTELHEDAVTEVEWISWSAVGPFAGLRPDEGVCCGPGARSTSMTVASGERSSVSHLPEPAYAPGSA